MKKKIDPKNFKLIEHHTHKAKTLHKKEVALAMDTEVANRFTEKKVLKMTQKKRDELREVKRENELAFYEVERLIA